MKDIESMAREAGMVVVGDQFSLLPFLVRFAALVRAQALEQAARVCEAQEYQYWRVSEDQDFTPQDCADAIRAIADTKEMT